ncbi:MAG: hypothetical protein JW969_08155 [Spirochaetales bacterium]|nr:hypothetical protein [Spirochaetales bacterium]
MNKAVLIVLFISIVLLFYGCDYLTQGIKPPNLEDIDYRLGGLQDIDQPEEEEEHVSGPGDCSSMPHAAAVGFPSNNMLKNDHYVIWPGSLLQGDSIRESTYIPISASRSELVVKFIRNSSLPIVKQNYHSPSADSFLYDVNSCWLPMGQSCTIRDLYSLSQVPIALSYHYRLPADLSDIKGILRFDDNNCHTRKIIICKVWSVKAFVVDISSPSDFFNPAVTWDDLAGQIQSLTSPLYVSEVTYGKMRIFCIVSDSFDYQINPELYDLLFNQEPGTSGITHLSASSLFELTVTSDNLFELTVIKPADLLDNIDEIRDCDFVDAPEPIEYTLNYLRTGFPGFSKVISAEYNKRTCDPKQYKVTVNTRDKKGNEEEWVCYVSDDGNIKVSTEEIWGTLGQQHVFCSWDLDPGNAASVEEPTEPDSMVNNITEDCVISALYDGFCGPTKTPTNTPAATDTFTPTGGVSTPTDTPTNTPTPMDTPTDTPTNTPTPMDTPTNTSTNTPTHTKTPTPMDTPTNTPANTPTPPTYSGVVHYVDGNGLWANSPFSGLKSSDSLSISTADTYNPGGNPLQFGYWLGSCMTFDNASSASTTIRNFSCNGDVTAVYQ